MAVATAIFIPLGQRRVGEGGRRRVGRREPEREGGKRCLGRGGTEGGGLEAMCGIGDMD